MRPRPSEVIGRVVIGRYRVLRELAKGGMGSVYLARLEGAAGFRKLVVIKAIRNELDAPAYRDHFRREGQILALLRHPNIVTILDFAEEEDRFLMALEYVHGHSASQWHRFARQAKQPISQDEATGLVLDVLEALEYAHTLESKNGEPLNIVHRDVKPSNILIDSAGHIKLADFGIARSEAHRTQSGSGSEAVVKGTYPYCAPELFEGAPASAASDVYACALVFYELMTGLNPFTGSTQAETLFAVMTRVPTPLRVLREDVPQGLSALIERSLSKDPEERPLRAMDLAAGLTEFLSDGRGPAKKRFNERIRRDFSDPKFAQVPGTLDLDTLEAALDEEGPVTQSTNGTVATVALGVNRPPDLKWGGEQGPPAALTNTPDTIPSVGAPPPRALPTRAMMAAAGLILAALIVFVTIRFTKSEEAQTYLVVGANHDVHDASPAARIDAPPPTKGPATESPEREHKSKGPAATIKKIIDDRQAQIGACSQQFAEQAPVLEEIEVELSLRAGGSVESVSLQRGPNNALTQCVLDVLKSTRFGNQTRALRFRFPIRIRHGAK